MTTIDYKYVIATFEECDVSERLGDDDCYEGLLDHIEEHDLMVAIVAHAVDELRDWFDWTAGDVVWDAIREAVKDVTGKSLADWEEGE